MDSRTNLSKAAVQLLEDFQSAGLSHLPKSTRPTQHKQTAAQPVPSTEESMKKQTASPPKSSRSAPSKPISTATERSLFGGPDSERPAMPPAERAAALEVVQREVAACVRCPVLVANRTQTVFGVGNNTAQICFFGEAPGADEDRLGEPFVGRGGQLLNKMIVACQLKREDVYIMNVLKCRPPDNRNPMPDEVANCRGYFERQLEIIRPEIICCLGAVASQSLLSTDRAIGKLRGKFHDYQGIPVVCTYHPAYLLRNPSAKTDAWEDLKMMMRRLGVEL